MLTFLSTLIIVHILVEGSVAFSISVTTSPRNEAEINSPVTLTCLYPGNNFKIVQLSWLKVHVDGSTEILIWRYDTGTGTDDGTSGNDDKYTLVKNVMNREHSIRINSVSSEDEAEYHCRIDAVGDRGYISKRASTTLSILVPPTDIQLKVGPDPLQAGTSASITCTILKVWPLTELSMEIWKGSENVGRLSAPSGKPIPDDVLAQSVTFPVSVETTKHDNEAKVQCIVMYRGKKFEASHDLNIHFPPSSLVLVKDPPGAVKEDSTVQITCFHDGANPQPTLILLQHNSPSSSLPVAEGSVRVDYSLSDVARQQNSVVFSCQAEGGALEDSVLTAPNNITLDVLFITDDLTMTEFPSSLVREDEPAYITCLTGSGNPTPRVKWDPAPRLNYDDKLIEELRPGDHGAQRLGSTYKIMADRHINLVTYTCSLVHKPSVSKNVTLEVKFEAVQVLHGPVPPTPEGEDIELSCNSLVSNPPTTFKWSLAGTEDNLQVETTQTSGPFFGTKSHSVAVVEGVTREQHGSIVTCVPDFDGTELREKTQSMTLNITYPPVVLAQVPQSAIMENSILLMQCVVSEEGNPPVYSFHWYRGNNQSRLEGEHSVELEIENVQAEDAGMYYCQASNHGGNSTLAGGKVNVSYRAREVAKSASNVVYAELGEEVQLNLTVRTYPEPTNCDWTLKHSDSSILNRPQGARQIQQGDEEDVYICSLTVPPVTEKSYGTYTATVSNIAGPLYVSFVLKQYGAPGPPLSMTVISDPTRELFMLSWYSGQDGGYPQTFSVFRRPVTGEESSPDENEENSADKDWILSKSGLSDPGFGMQTQYDLDVKGEEYMEYEFMVRSVNQLGRTDSKIIRGHTVTTPTFEGNYTYSSTDDTVTLRWTPLVGAYDQVMLRHCPADGGTCMDYDVKGRHEFQLNGTGQAVIGTFQLMVMHAGRQLAVSPDFIHMTPTGGPGSAAASIAGGIIGALAVLLIIFLIIAFIFAKKRKAGRGSDAPEVSSHSGSYVAIANNTAGPAESPAHYDEVVVRDPKRLPDENGDPSTSPDIVSSHTWQPKPAPRKKHADRENENPRGLSVSIPPMSPHGPQYENLSGQKEPLYDNVQVRNGREPNQESVIYAKLDLPDIPEGETPLIHGDTDKTEYVAIDFNRPPVPLDSDSD